MPISFSPQQRRFMQQQFEQFAQKVNDSEIGPIFRALEFRQQPPSLSAYLLAVEALQAVFHSSGANDASFEIDERFAPLLKAVLIARRRVVAGDVDRRRAKTVHPEAIAVLTAELAEFDDFAAQMWYRETTPYPVPRLAEFVTLEEVQQVMQLRNVRLAEREFDEKFHLLQAPSLMLSDLMYYREMSGARRNPVALAFIDIDDFKHLNTVLGHQAVDLRVLPIFMRAMEAFSFARGFAYRMGGDEYAVLLGNGRGALGAFDELRRQLSGLRYDEVPDSVTVSGGVVVVAPDCELSDMSVLERANRAMRHAKDHGKNCVSTYVGGFDDAHLTLWPASGAPSPGESESF